MIVRRGGRERYYRDRKREEESEKIIIVGRGRETLTKEKEGK